MTMSGSSFLSDQYSLSLSYINYIAGVIGKLIFVVCLDE